VGLHVKPRAEARAEAGWRAQLETLCGDRARLVESWVARRLAEASVIARFPTVAWMQGGRLSRSPPFPVDEGAEAHLRGLLTESARVQGLRSAWVFGDGWFVASEGAVEEGIARLAGRSVQKEVAAVAGFFFDDAGEPLVAFGALAAPDASAAVVLLAPPQRHLCGWPLLDQLQTTTGECLLLRRQGERAEYLTLPRHTPTGTLTTPPLPAEDQAAAAAWGAPGRTGWYTDYRGQAVLAASCRVEAAPWALLVKVDRREVLSGARAEIREEATLLGLGLVALLAILYTLARHSRARHELSLARRDAQLSALLEDANDAILLIDRSGRIRGAHGAAEALYGKSRAEFTGMPIATLGGQGAGELQSAFEAGQLVFATEHVCAEGIRIPVEVSARRVRLDDEELLLAIVRDVRERVRAEEALRKARERYRIALLHSPVVVFELDRDLRYTWVHDPDSRLLGDGTGDAAGEVLSAPSARRLARLERQVLETGAGVRQLAELTRADGAEPVFDLTLEPLRDREGALIGVIGAAVDVTSSREREARLRQLSRATEQSPSAVIITDTRGRIEYVNPAFTAITGYSAEDVVGRNPRLLKSGQQSDAFYAEMWATILAGREWRGELRNRAKDGEQYWAFLTIAPLLDEDGAVTHFVGVQQDLTARRETERQLEDARRQLLQSQKLEAVGRLAGGVAHDFNNLLNVIMGFTELLEKDLPPASKGHGRVEQIMKAAARAGDLTRQLLAFSRRQVLQPQVVDLAAALRDFSTMLRRVIGEDVELSIETPAEALFVRVDPGQIEQVLMNLAVNARDAMPQGGSLSLAASRARLDRAYAASHGPVEPGDYVLVAVADTGVGMDAGIQARVFEPFFSTKAASEGTGLGLATVYGIVKQSGGYIWVYSEVGRGTTFKIYLPVVEPAGPQEAVVEAAAPRALGGESILLVEDQLSLREMIREVLVDLGYRVEEAADGPQALERARERGEPVDLLLTDLVMPRMSGRELAHALRERWPGLRVLYMSGYTADVVARHGILEPGLHLIQKPFATTDLARRVKETLEAPPQA